MTTCRYLIGDTRAVTRRLIDEGVRVTRGLCLSSDLDFTDISDANVPQCQAICRACPVAVECLERAEAAGAYGICGGVVLGHRRTRRGAPIPHGTEAGHAAHYRRGELPPCPACDAAHRDYCREYKARNRKAAA